MMGKWGKKYWADLFERVLSTEVGALLAMFTLTGSTSVDWSDGKAVWAVLGVPAAVSFLKGLAANLPGPEASASVIDVKSNTADIPPAE